MGHKCWTTTAEKAWLKARCTDFRRVQTNGEIGTFITSKIQEYFDEFFPGTVIPSAILDAALAQKQQNVDSETAPKPPTTTAVAADGRQVDILARTKQVRWWFYNQRPGKSGAEAEKTAMFNFAPKKTPKPQVYQAYWRLNKDKVNEEANKRYEAYQKKLKEGKAEDAGGESNEPDDAKNGSDTAGMARECNGEAAGSSDSEPGGESAKSPVKGKGCTVVCPWISFAIEVVREMLEEASNKEKEAVEEYWAKLSVEHPGLELFAADGDPATVSGGDAQALHKCAVDIQNAINSLLKVLQNILDSIEKQTGWIGTIIVGGPTPEMGKLMAMITHLGHTQNLGYNFAEATDKWRPVEDTFDKFLTSCYTPTAWKKLTDTFNGAATPDRESPVSSAATADNIVQLSSTSDRTSPSNNSVPTNSPHPLTDNALSAANRGGEPEPSRTMQLEGVAAENTATTSQKKAGEEVEQSYDEMVEEQWAKVRAHMIACGVMQAATAFNKQIEPKKRAPRKSANNADAPTKKPGARPQTRSAMAASGAAATLATTPATPAPSQTSTALASTADSLNGAVPAEAHSLPPPVSVQPGAGAGASSPAVTSDSSVAIEARLASSPVSGTQSTLVTVSVAEPVPLLPTSPHSPLQADVAQPVHPGPGGPPVPQPQVATLTSSIGVPSPLSGSPPAGPEPANSLVGVRNALSLPRPASASKNSPPPIVADSDTDMHDNSDTTVVKLIDQNAPKYVTEAVNYFSLIDGGGPDFVKLVEHWQVFEADRGYPGGQKPDHRLPVGLRPPEIQEWMKVGRSFENLPLIEPKTFAPAWKAWWTSLQPPCHVDADVAWPLQRVEPGELKDWDLLWRGGPNGFFLIVLSLAWLLWAVSENEEEEATNGITLAEVLEAISDVLWVLSLAVPSSSSSNSEIWPGCSGQKRPFPGEEGCNESESANKRIRGG